jgi:branched-chain amino acid aminotransferase
VEPVISIDGVLVVPEQATISVLDRGLLYGDGCFEVLRTWSGAPVDLAAHLDRMYATVAAMRMRAMERGALAAAVDRTIAAAGQGEHRIRIVITRGPGGLGEETAALGPGRAIVIVEPLGEQPREISAAIVDWPLPGRSGHAHKTLAYLDHVIARDLARAARADEAIRLDADGRAVEGATSNLFAVIGGTVVTAPVDGGLLPGVVRGRVLAVCGRERIAAREEAFTVQALRGADEIFVSSSLRGVVAVTRLDGVACVAGPITGRIAGCVAAEMHALGAAASAARV